MGQIRPTNSSNHTNNIQTDNNKQQKAKQSDQDNFSQALKKGKKKDNKQGLKSPAELLRKRNEEDKNNEHIIGEGVGKNALGTKFSGVENVKGDSMMLQRAEQIADKIMVQNVKDVKEVNVKFSDNLLQATEVTIKREVGGIRLEFATSSPESLNFINRGEAALLDALNKRMDSNVTIDVNYTGNDQQSSDGRSKNSYFFDEQSEQDD